MKGVGDKDPGGRIHPLLEVRDLRISFGAVTVVDGVSLSLAKGEVLGIVGESGSGKSATALAIMGLIAPPGRVSASTIRFDGEDLGQADERRMRAIRGAEISMIFQEPMSALNPVLRVGEQIIDVLRKHRGMTRRQARRAAIEMLGRVGIPSPGERVDSYPHEMSGGMRQRAMIAMALACSPRLLIADEPTTALDVTIQAQILDLLLGLRSEMGMSMILITHDLGVVAQVADRVNVMYAGRVVETASVEALFETPSHPYTAALLGSMPSLTADATRLAAIPGTVPQPSEWGSGCRFAPRCAHAVAACTAGTPSLRDISAAQQVACIRHAEVHHGSAARER